VYVYVYAYVCVCVHMCVCVRVCVCACVFMRVSTLGMPRFVLLKTNATWSGVPSKSDFFPLRTEKKKKC